MRGVKGYVRERESEWDGDREEEREGEKDGGRERGR